MAGVDVPEECASLSVEACMGQIHPMWEEKEDRLPGNGNQWLMALLKAFPSSRYPDSDSHPDHPTGKALQQGMKREHGDVAPKNERLQALTPMTPT